MPYAIMFDEDCDTDFCDRVIPPLTRSTRALARVGDGGRFVPADGAGHEIYAASPELVLADGRGDPQGLNARNTNAANSTR